MKITVVAKQEEGWHIGQLKQKAQELNVEFEQVDFKNLNDAKESIKNLGNVILWRSSSISPSVERTTLLSLVKDKFIINHAVIKQPFLSYKLYQQKMVQAYTRLNNIPTYTFKDKNELKEAVQNGILKYPFIQKPNLGSKGEGVSLVRTENDIEGLDIKFKDFIYQNFIKNSGDYRVLILGGKALGVMKRTAMEGSFLNNVSQGGKATVVEDQSIVNELTDMGLTIASLFDLTMCGVDIIYDEEKQYYTFLEVNTAPQWEGFQSATGINVSEKILELCIQLASRKEKSTFECVDDYYNKNFDYLYAKKVHFSSRMYLWTGEEKYKNKIEELQRHYVGITEQETDEIISRRLSHKDAVEPKTLAKKLRLEHSQNYPDLQRFNSILFLNTFAKSLYGKDLTGIINKYVSDKELIQLRDLLMKDINAIYVLSTHAVNFCYLLENYLIQKNKTERYIDPEFFFKVAMEQSVESSAEDVRFKIYLLTHCIIAESLFYSREVEYRKDMYLKMIKYLEEFIFANYFASSLDNKFEFLVCAELCGYESSLKSLIMSEADNSFSPLGNYLINKEKRLDNKMTIAEHRNVLYLMANQKFRLHT